MSVSAWVTRALVLAMVEVRMVAGALVRTPCLALARVRWG